MRIIKPTEAITVDHPVILIVGQWGIGKTTLGCSFNTLTYDFDNGASRAVNRRDIAAISAWSDVDLSREVLRNYSGATFDTVARALALLSAAIIDENPKNGSNGTLNQRGWGILRQRFGGVLDTLESYRLDVLLLAHAKEVRDGELRKIVADIPGGSYAEIMRRAHFVGYLALVNGKRVLDFNPTDKFIGKNPGRWEPIEVPPAHQAQSFMAQVFDEGRKALGRISEASARIAAAVQRWQGEIAGYVTADDFTAGFVRLRSLKDSDLPVYTQAHHVLAVAAKAAGMRFNTQTSAFEFSGVRPPAPAPLPSVVARRAATVQPRLDSMLTPAGVQ